MNDSPILLCVCALLAACAGTPHRESTSMRSLKSASEIMRGVPVVIAQFDAHSDVVTIPADRQYVLDPTASALTLIDPLVSGVSFFSRRPFPTAQLDGKVTDASSSSTFARDVPSDEEIRLAWRKYCYANATMTLADWRIIDTTRTPTELKFVWTTECVQRK